MPPRNRNYVTNTYKGTGGRFGEVWGGHSNTIASSSSASDITGPGDGAPFSVEKVWFEGGRFSQGVVGSYWSPWFKDYVADVHENLANFPHIDGGGFDEDLGNVAYATKAVARTNPSRPYVDVPVNILQLGEVAQLLQRRGNDLIAEAGRENLRYQFGIAPLVGDLIKLQRLHEALDVRMQEIEKLKGNTGLRRTIGMASFCKVGTHTRTYQSVGTFLTGVWKATTTLNITAHVRWSPDHTFPRGLSVPDLRALVTRALVGGTIDASTIWEVIPWSWLIDWGSTVGDYFSANRNIIPAKLLGVSIQRLTRTEFVMTPGAFSDITIGPSNVFRKSYRRDPSFAAPIAHFPFLNGNQVGILASLAVTRM